MKTPEILDKMANAVLAYRPAPKSKAAKRRRKKATKKAKAHGIISGRRSGRTAAMINGLQGHETVTVMSDEVAQWLRLRLDAAGKPDVKIEVVEPLRSQRVFEVRDEN